VAQIGLGAWGANLVRNVDVLADLVWICDASEERRDLHVATREFRIDRERLREHLLQRDIVRDPAQERVRDVVMQIDEARDHGGTGAIDHLRRSGIDGADGSDPTVVHEDVAREHPPMRILCDDETAPEQEGHGVRRWGDL